MQIWSQHLAIYTNVPYIFMCVLDALLLQNHNYPPTFYMSLTRFIVTSKNSGQTGSPRFNNAYIKSALLSYMSKEEESGVVSCWLWYFCLQLRQGSEMGVDVGTCCVWAVIELINKTSILSVYWRYVLSQRKVCIIEYLQILIHVFSTENQVTNINAARLL